MSRLVTCGFELGSTTAPEGQGYSSTGTVSIVDAASQPTKVRSGDFALRANGTVQSGALYGSGSGLGVEDRTYFGRASFNFANFGAGYGSAAIMGFQLGPSPFTTVAAVRLTPAGNLQLAYNTGTGGPQFIGPAVAINLNQQYVVELECRISAAGNDIIGWRLDGVLQHEDTAAVIGTTMGDVLTAGYLDPVAGATTAVDVYVDDVALNDDIGTTHNSWPGSGKIVMLRPISDASRVGWTDNAGATTSLYDALDNTPPIGEAPPGVALRNMAAPVYTATNVANGAINPALPTRVNGDVLVLFAWTEHNAATITAPSGWTALTGSPFRHTTALGGTLYVYVRLVDGSETAPAVTWAGLTTGNTGTPAGAVIGSFSGVDTSGGIGSIFDGTAAASSNAAAANISAPSITTALDNSGFINFGVKTVTSTTFTGPGTEILDTNTASGADMGSAAYLSTKTPAGATGVQTITSATTTSNLSLGVTFALKAKAATAKAQIKDANNNNTDVYEANMESYSTAGIGAGDTITIVQALANGGNSSATGRTLTVGITSNPAISESGSVTGATPAGAYPTGWRDVRSGALVNPTGLTLGTSPVAKLRKGTASADTMYFAALGIYVEYVPAAAATTPVDGDVLDLLWDTPAAVDSATLDLLWDTIAQVSSPTLDLLWDARAQVDSAVLDLLWDASVPVNSSVLDLLWDTIAQVSSPTLDLLWDTIAQVNSGTLDLLWDTRTGVDSAVLDLLWDTRSSVSGSTLDLLWDTIAQVNSGTLDLLWDTRSSVDSAVLDLLWDARVAVAGDVADLLWDTRAAVAGSVLDFLWDSRSSVDSAVLDLLWDTRAAVERLLTLKWDLAGTVPTFPVDGPVLDLLWDSRAAVNGSVADLLWDTRAAVAGSVLDFLWDARVPVAGDVLDLLWDARSPVAGPVLDLLWDARSPVGGPVLDLLWDNRAAVDSAVLDLRWRLVAQVVAAVLTLRWDVIAVGGRVIGRSHAPTEWIDIPGGGRVIRPNQQTGGRIGQASKGRIKP